jgi:NADH dehydrogenase
VTPSGVSDPKAASVPGKGPELKTRIVILGGGFGGIYAALELERTLARDPSVSVVLVNRDNFILFTPMLHEVAASDLDVTHIVNPIRKMLRRVQVFHGDVTAVDLANRRVHLTHGEDEHPHELEYDHLLLALGSITTFYGLPGLAERALTMKTLGDAIHLRNHVIECLEAADFECACDERDKLLAFVVAGGGFAGVETIAALNDFLRDAVRFYPNLSEDHFRLVLVHGGDRLLPELSTELSSYTLEKLQKLGVEVALGTRVLDLDGRTVKLDNGNAIETQTLVWTAGTEPNPLVRALPVRVERGRIAVDEFLAVEGWPGVWAIGDCAAVPDKKAGGFQPPTAQHASRQGHVAARNIVATIRGGRKRPFSFSTLGQLAAIGRRRGVARILGLNFSGFFAWWLWRTIYLAKLPGWEKKVRVVLDWSFDVLFSKDLVQIPTRRTRGGNPAREVRGEERGAPPVSASVAGS